MIVSVLEDILKSVNTFISDRLIRSQNRQSANAIHTVNCHQHAVDSHTVQVCYLSLDVGVKRIEFQKLLKKTLTVILLHSRKIPYQLNPHF